MNAQPPNNQHSSLTQNTATGGKPLGLRIGRLAPAAAVSVGGAFLTQSQVYAATGKALPIAAAGIGVALIADLLYDKLFGAPAPQTAQRPQGEQSGVGVPNSIPTDVSSFAPIAPPGDSTNPPAPAVRRVHQQLAKQPANWTALAAPKFDVALSFTTSKVGSPAEENEDAFALDETVGRFVVCDGASSSFASRQWSRSLADALCRANDPIGNPADRAEAHASAARLWRELATPSGDETPWWAVEGIRKGAFATAVVVDVKQSGSSTIWRAAAIGDSCLFQVRWKAGSWSLVTSFPMKESGDFGSYPDLAHSSSAINETTVQTSSGELRKDDRMIVASDAVSEWIFDDLARLNVIMAANAEALLRLANAARNDHSMVNDDVTFLHILTV